MEEPNDTIPTEPDDVGSEEAADTTAQPDPLAAMMEVDPDGAEQLHADWGEDFDHNLSLARRAATVFGDPALRAVLEESGLGDDPRIVRVAAEIGRMMQQRAPDRLDQPNSGHRTLETRLRELNDRDDYWSPAIQREVREIYLQLHGDQSLSIHRDAGDAGRPGW